MKGVRVVAVVTSVLVIGLFGLFRGFDLISDGLPKTRPVMKPATISSEHRSTRVALAAPEDKPCRLPRIIYTACCWCPRTSTKTNSCFNHLYGDEITFLQESGIDASFLQMPGCSKASGGPDVNSAAFQHYSETLRAANARGDVVISATNSYLNSKRCLDEEVSNVWVQRALSSDQALVDQRMALQNKRNLHDVFTAAGLSAHVPAIYNKHELDKVKFPVFLKETKGSFGRGISIVKSQDELKKALKQAKDAIIEEALVADRAYVIHYLRRPNSPITSVWCGMYHNKKWKKTGLYIQGIKDYSAPKPQPVLCHPSIAEMIQTVLEFQDVHHVGCINGKGPGIGNLKIFDWNLRMCASLRPHILKSLLRQQQDLSSAELA